MARYMLKVASTDYYSHRGPIETYNGTVFHMITEADGQYEAEANAHALAEEICGEQCYVVYVHLLNERIERIKWHEARTRELEEMRRSRRAYLFNTAGTY